VTTLRRTSSPSTASISRSFRRRRSDGRSCSTSPRSGRRADPRRWRSRTSATGRWCGPSRTWVCRGGRRGAGHGHGRGGHRDLGSPGRVHRRAL